MSTSHHVGIVSLAVSKTAGGGTTMRFGDETWTVTAILFSPNNKPMPTKDASVV